MTVEPVTYEAVQTRLLLLRCGAADWEQAADGEPPLTASGLLEVELTTAMLPRFDAVVASPQRPTRETAETIAAIRTVPVGWRDELDEIRTAAPLTDAGAYAAWLDRLFEAYRTSADGESLAEGVERMTAALRAVGDRFYGRTVLVVSHPVILLAFRANLLGMAVSRDHVEMLPDLALAAVDYLEGRFYLVRDFPMRQITG